MRSKQVILIILAAFGLLGLNFFLLSVTMELIRGRNDMEVLIGMILIPATVVFDYLSILKLYKTVKK